DCYKGFHALPYRLSPYFLPFLPFTVQFCPRIMSLLSTLWPLFLKELGFDNFQIGVVQSVNAMTQFIVMYLLTDSLKSESLLPAGLLLSCFTFITFLMTENFYLFLITQVFLGISWAALYVGAVKYITENNPFNERGTASGFLASTLSVSGLVGPFYAFAFLQLFQEEDIFHLIIIFAVIMSIFGLISFYFLQKIPNRDLEINSLQNH
ncbi:MAG: MFS transporter, partial [Candidatus Hodarchaeales archaeon]